MSKKKLIAILGTIVIVIILSIFVISVLFKNKDKDNEDYDKDYIISSLAELFPNKEIKQKYTDGTGNYEISFKEPTSKNGVTTIVTEYDTKIEDEVFTVKMNYEIFNDKIIESGTYNSGDQLISTIYPKEIILGIPYTNMTWKSSNGLITNTVISMVNNQVTIESVSKVDFYEEEKKAPIKKNYKETRVYEKGKGIILYRTEIVGEETSVSERKIVE